MNKPNLYPGINPHLNSHLLHIEGWNGFHYTHIEAIAQALNTCLPLAYEAIIGESLQKSPLGAAGGSMGWVSVIIQKRADSVILTRIELMTPNNVLPSLDAGEYQDQRQLALRAGTNLVELDYICSAPPLLTTLPSYPAQEKDAQAYVILVSNPRSRNTEGTLRAYSFGVLDTIPSIEIPLDDTAVIQCDFNAIYQHTFSDAFISSEAYTDYTIEPAFFDDYTPADQQLIRQHMVKIKGEIH